MNKAIIFSFLFGLLCILFLVKIPFSQQTNYPMFKNEISSRNLIKTVKYLSSENLKGRLPGNEGYNKAASYMADEFRKYGILPYIDSTYFQYFTVEYNWISTPCRLNLIEDTKVIKKYKLGKDFVCRGFSGSGQVTASVVFCGYGLSRNDLGYDDYKDIDVKGKIVMVFKPMPAWNINNNT